MTAAPAPGLSVSAAARRLGVSDDTCRDWFDRGTLTGFRTPAGFRRIILDPNLEEHVTVSTAARMLGLSEQTVRSRFDDGRLTGYRLLSGQRRITRSSIDRLNRGRR